MDNDAARELNTCVPHLSAIEVCSGQGAIQIHMFTFTLPLPKSICCLSWSLKSKSTKYSDMHYFK